MIVSIQAKLDAFREDFEAGGPPAYNAPSRILIVSFYRGVWCPYCNMEVQALQAALPGFERLGATPVESSPQAGANSRESRRDNRATFPILSDPGNEVAAAFGLRSTLPDYLR